MTETGSFAHLPSRRAAVRAGLAMGLSGLLLPAVNACTPDDRGRTVTVAGGEPGGFYLEFSTLLAESLERHEVVGTAVPQVTGGSLENIQRLLAGDATFAVSLADAAAQQAAAPASPATAPPSGAGGIVALGKVYENYVHCLVRKDSGIRTFADLAGKTAAIGEVGSGTSLTAHRIITASGLSATVNGAGNTASNNPLREVNFGLNDGLAALRAGSVDALFWSGGVPTAAITAVNKEVGLALIDLSAQVRVTRARYGGFYDRVLIPENSYEGIPGSWTVGVANLLLCREDLDHRIVKRTVELLVGQARELIPRSSLGVQFLSPETLINTVGVPLHPAAAAAYRDLHG
ncbi:TAXI family TRAP transporter solute-binding subunit [Arthrobacter sp. ISL-72]|uniref:TAXI family TRAP transporter solute-binding subunit n=1 Tax=Arthrobacter sp. ISL-72 TaxID=2819114 RepID=UPI001BE7B0B7|nr:TAXI family TRAP transporter solute-binding subunit [Arthrobacter sp. ISL-72]MBT2597543.1 TAXI family TRAP transporter solute-binding subunit [Arthrobacter sp. ISL-72]